MWSITDGNTRSTHHLKAGGDLCWPRPVLSWLERQLWHISLHPWLPLGTINSLKYEGARGGEQTVKGTDESEGKGTSGEKYFCTPQIWAQDILLWLSQHIKSARVLGEKRNYSQFYHPVILAPSEALWSRHAITSAQFHCVLVQRHQLLLCRCQTPL